MPEFLDALLAPLRALARRTRPTQEVGAGGTAVYGGYIQRIEKSAALTGTARYRTFSEALANNPTLGASARLVLRLAARAPWSVSAADDSAEALEIAEFVEASIYGMRTPWHRAVRRASTFALYGFSVQEWTMRRDEQGRLVLHDIETRPQRTIERWDLDTSGTVHTIIQRSPQTQEEIPIPRWKCVHVVDDSLDDTPEGLGMLRQVIETSIELRRFEQLEGIGFDVDLRGVPIGRVPFVELESLVTNRKITPEQRDAMLLNIRKFVEDRVTTPSRGLILDSQVWTTTDEKGTPSSQKQWDVELLKAQGEMGHQEVGAAIERKKREIASVFGTEGILLGSTSTGSLAMSNRKSADLRGLVDAILIDVGEAFQSDLVLPLVELNGWPADLAPELRPAALRHEDVEEVSAALKNLSDAGAPLDPFDEAINSVRDLLGLPTLDLEEVRRRSEEREAAMRQSLDQTGIDDDKDDEALALPNGRGGSA